MVVQHNLTAMNSNRMLGITTNAQAKSTEKLSSGYKINRAADDAAGLSISEKMRRQIRGLTQASTNAQDGVSLAQTAEGALAEVQDMLQRMNELSVKSANGTYTTTQRGYISDEINQLTSEIDRIATTTKFNDQLLFSADKTFGLQIGAENSEQLSLQTKAMRATDLGLTSGTGLSWSSDTTGATAGTYITTVKDALEKVASQRSSLGAYQNRLEHTISNLDNIVENTTAAESRVRDTDMATEMVKYSNNNILAQAGQAMLAQANQTNQGVLSLLQ
ncbi:flagellin [Kineothrix alysoides]|uniref:Flagellin n=1 Tax=Kineothrix alysoides TaxID=1469948 RepID=A0A4R1QK28_9FIRM|nr:flagellin [Kineothrix alysoides]TCL54019.1 flagellin [Kineothrix alysoides]